MVQCNAFYKTAVKRDQGHKLEMNINLSAVDTSMHSQREIEKDSETLGGNRGDPKNHHEK